MIDKIALKKFLVDFAKNGYATGDEKAWKKESDGSTSIRYEKGKWAVHDNFFGGEPFGGREIVFYDKKPVWFMSYYGAVDNSITDVNIIYKFLRKALESVPKDFPYRGPKLYAENELTYVNSWSGDIDNFSGKEYIEVSEKQVFTTIYFGGYVNGRSGV